jgi:hypothetical protein
MFARNLNKYGTKMAPGGVKFALFGGREADRIMARNC